MAERGAPMTSESLARCLGTNPVVVRRSLGLLRDAGLVGSDRGHGGGWTVTRDLSAITLRDVYAALGEPSLFGLSEGDDATGCCDEQAVHGALGTAFREARAAMMEQLAAVDLESLAADSHRRAARQRSGGNVRARARRKARRP